MMISQSIFLGLVHMSLVSFCPGCTHPCEFPFLLCVSLTQWFPRSKPVQNKDYWVAVMKVADLYNVAAAKEDAMHELANQVQYLRGCPIQAIELGHHFNIKEWFEHGF
jgi:hypothetical protein